MLVYQEHMKSLIKKDRKLIKPKNKNGSCYEDYAGKILGKIYDKASSLKVLPSLLNSTLAPDIFSERSK